MTLGELEKSIAELRSRPLLLVCQDGKGRQKIMGLEECRRTGSVYVHIAADDLDALLSAELGGDNAQNRQKNAT
jgi:hypothetical protein